MTDIGYINARMPFNRRILLLLCAFVFGLGLSSFVALIVHRPQLFAFRWCCRIFWE